MNGLSSRRHRAAGKVRLAAAVGVVVGGVVGLPAWGQTTPTTAYWVAPASGLWSDATKWSTAPTYPNGSLYDVVLNATGAAHTVTTATDGSVNHWPSVNRVTLDSPDVTLAGGVTAKEVDVVDGTWRLFDKSLSSGARVSVGAGGRIDIPAQATVKWQDMTLASDLTVTNATLDLSGWYTYGLTLEDCTLRFVNTSSAIAGGGLLGRGRVVFEGGAGAVMLAAVGRIDPGIDVQIDGPTVQLGSPMWSNAVINQGSVTIAPGAGAVVYGKQSVNQGVINVGDGGMLFLMGFATAADIGTVNRGANTTVIWAPTISAGTGSAGVTLDLNAGPGGLKELGPATLTGVTVTAAGRTVKVYGNPPGDPNRNASTLTGVTLAGNFDFQYGTQFNVLNGLNLGGTVRFGGFNWLMFNDAGGYQDNPQTIGGTGEIVFDRTTGTTGTLSTLYSGPALTIGAGVTLRNGSGDGWVTRVPGNYLPTTLINEGTISARGAGRSITIDATLVNHGTIEAVDGGTIALLAPFTNSGTIRLADSTLRLGGTSNYQTLGQLTASNSVVAITGTFDNTGRTLDMASPGQGFALTFGPGGTIKGGTVTRGDGSAVRVSGVAGSLTDAVVDVPIVVDGAPGSALTFNRGRADGGITVEGGGSLTLGGARSDAPAVYGKPGSTVNIQGTSSASVSVASPANFRLDGARLNLYSAAMTTGAFDGMSATNATVAVGSGSVLNNAGATLTTGGGGATWGVYGGKITGGRIEGADAASAIAADRGTLENVTVAASVTNRKIGQPSLETVTIAGTFAMEPNRGAPVSMTVDGQAVFSSGSVSTIKGTLTGKGTVWLYPNAQLTVQSLRNLTLQFNGASRLALMPSAEGGGVSHLPGIFLGTAVTLDVADAPILFDYWPNPRGAIASGYAGGTWGGTGVTSSYAATHPGTGIGYATAGELLGITGAQTATLLGETVSPGATLIRLTRAGDATLDGVVNFDDLLRLAKSYGQAPAGSAWYAGDFDYNGTVNFDDLLVLAKNYNGAIPGGPWTLNSPAADFQADVAAAFAAAAVPEPGMLGGAACLGGAMMMRRGRRRAAGR